MLTKDEELYMRGQVSGTVMTRFQPDTTIDLDEIADLVIAFVNIALKNAENKEVSTAPEIDISQVPDMSEGPKVHTPLDKMISTKEASKILKIGNGTLSAWRKKGKGPKFTKEGRGKYTYRRGDVFDWARDNPKVIERALKMSGAMKRAYIKKAQREGPKSPSTFPAELKL